MSRPVCRCHGEPQLSNGSGKWVCAVKKRAQVAQRDRRLRSDQEWLRRRRAQQLAYYHRRKNDPDYQLDRQLREMCRIRVR